MLIGVVAAVGLATDAGLAFSARRSLQGIADAAATAGAQQINVELYRQSNGEMVELDPQAAYDAAVARIQAASGGGRFSIDGYSVTVSTTRVDVAIQGRARIAFLPAVLPIARTVPVKATAWALPRYGIASAQ